MRVDLSLRQALLLNDIALVRRILRNNPSYLHNPDYSDKSNTSLHLAARYGLEEIAVGTQCSQNKPSGNTNLRPGVLDLTGP